MQHLMEKEGSYRASVESVDCFGSQVVAICGVPFRRGMNHRCEEISLRTGILDLLAEDVQATANFYVNAVVST